MFPISDDEDLVIFDKEVFQEARLEVNKILANLFWKDSYSLYFAHLLDIYDERSDSYSKTGLAFYVLAIFLVWFG